MNAAQFNRLPRKKQRLLIAKDVLKRLKKRQLKPTNRVWVKPLLEAENGASLQTYIKKGKPCEVCALGGVMASFAGFANDINFHQAGYFNDRIEAHFHKKKTRKRLTRIFGKEMLRNIEFTFEGGGGMFDSSRFSAKEGELKEKLFTMHLRFEHQKYATRNLFRAIFDNIVRNKGDFVVR